VLLYTVVAVIHSVNSAALTANHRASCQYLQTLSFKFEIIILSEIWSYYIEFYGNILPGYTFHYVLHSSSSLGGIGMYIKSKYAQVVLNNYVFCSSINCQRENLWIEITHGEIKYTIGGTYRHPNGIVSEFCNNFERTLHKISQQNIPCIIAGDLNINLLKCNSDRHTDEYFLKKTC